MKIISDLNILKTFDKVELECEKCGKHFFKTKKFVINGMKRYKDKYKFCNLTCRDLYNGRLKLCECFLCGKEISRKGYEFSKSKNHFCSTSCSAKYYNSIIDRGLAFTEEKRKKLSEWAKIHAYRPTKEECRRNKLPIIPSHNVCECCGKSFKLKQNKSKQKYCSVDCASKSPKMGGYRQGSGRSKSGYYKGIYCGSTYELCWVIYSLDHNIKFTRFNEKLEGDGIVYYPDFLLGDKKTIIETKGFEDIESVNKKTKLAESLGFTVEVLRKDELQYAFDYVEFKYKTKKFYTLYDEYKPYEYKCSYCNTTFNKDRKITTDEKFCNRICSGKFRKSKNILMGVR